MITLHPPQIKPASPVKVIPSWVWREESNTYRFSVYGYRDHVYRAKEYLSDNGMESHPIQCLHTSRTSDNEEVLCFNVEVEKDPESFKSVIEGIYKEKGKYPPQCYDLQCEVVYREKEIIVI